MRRAASLLFLILASACATKAPEGPPPAPVPYKLIAHALDRATLSPVERWGYDMYLRDLVASRATDAARDEVDLEKSGAVGWIVVPYEQAFMLRFITHDERAVVDVSVDPFSALSAYVMIDHPPKPLSDRERAMWRARQLALTVPFQLCSERYNPVVIPETDAPDSNWLVYLIAATTDPTRIMLGGHHKFRIDPEGQKVLEHLPLSTACTTGVYTENAAMIVVTNTLSSEPLESHVYLSLLHGIPLVVMVPAEGKRWRVEDGRIRPMEH